ncbi:MAG: MotA/TolQ/ExbB proton channel family protein [Chitinophagales bacterium]|nr:MotA/TolQ/ExbB proton channel family protein [Chitinophagales bacterium]
MDLFFLQAIDTLPDGSMTQTTSMFELALKGGPVMIPIALCSVVGLYIFVERYLTLQKASKIDENFMSNIRDFVMSDNIPAAKALCKQTNSPVARMIEKGIDRIGKPLRDIEASIENVGKMELFKLERGIGILATVAGLAPMLGFFGTVTGMVRAFYNMANAGNNISVGLLSGGIYEALVTTVAGLAVGIPALVCYNWLIGLIDKIVNKMEANSIEFIDLLQEPV